MTSELVRSHPVLECVAVLEAALTPAVDLDPGWLSAGEKRAVLLALTAVESRLEGLRLRVLAAGDVAGDVAADDGARDAAAWLAHHARLDSNQARRLGRLSTALSTRYTRVGAALSAGDIDPARAEVVVKALDDLPDDLDADVRDRAEEVLVDQAREFEPRRLRILGRRVLGHVAPEVAEAHEARLLDDEDTRGRASAFLRTRRRGDGTTDLHARLPDAAVARLMSYLHAFTSPRQSAAPTERPSERPSERPAERTAERPAQAPVDRRPYDQKLGHAFIAFLETIDPHRLPLHGGDATTVLVTIDLDTLRRDRRDTHPDPGAPAPTGDSGVSGDSGDSGGSGRPGGTGDTSGPGVAHVGDTPITAAQARRLACTAGIIPVVLGGESQVLDLGRRRRLFSPAQRKALTLHHPVCAADGCDIPSAWCEAHHAGTPWSRGGHTDLTEGVLLCSHHHHRAHDPRYETTRPLDGSVRFHRRT